MVLMLVDDKTRRADPKHLVGHLLIRLALPNCSKFSVVTLLVSIRLEPMFCAGTGSAKIHVITVLSGIKP